MSYTLIQKIETLLFYKGEPLSLPFLVRTCESSESEVRAALRELVALYQDRGMVIVEHDDTYMMTTHPDVAPLIETMRKQDRATPLSKSALETLAIIMYRNGITKSELDYIRGVNSQFMIRNLLIRGLVERIPNPEDKRSPLYRPTMDMFAFLGITHAGELPGYDSIVSEIADALQEYPQEDDASSEDHDALQQDMPSESIAHNEHINEISTTDL
ncbi:MAG: SMC-Scp complex subunit ScpB [Candidatus Pacebacteria bacterium]|nr:SMC-Scp complex subunit ScpB [Candidatus Paceibacterota bacterium]MCD8507943.1 SMC-Scp complex subunit ScpB [Candidatus Paceibacterota bacterium]MCD8528154.1 SMC-Scp complex subunit ScpB [Candidatus Paceibacterota bacterium]MCD8563650.1 SMC-Scp complex subunit ScpB [Candidatus Paceibacterota bacterium]